MLAVTSIMKRSSQFGNKASKACSARKFKTCYNLPQLCWIKLHSHLMDIPGQHTQCPRYK